MNEAAGHRLVPHTADMGIEAWAPDLAGVFVEAASGLREMLFGDAEVAQRLSRPVQVAACNRAELLVAWLNEILYHLETAGLVPAAFVVTRVDEDCLEAVVRGEPLDARRHPVERQVKAATYHRLALEERPDGWHARVYLDL